MAAASRIVIALLIVVFTTFSVVAGPNFPALSGRVIDQAGIVPYADRQELEQTLKELEAKSSDQLVVVTLKSLEGLDIADYGYQLGRHWQIGQAPLSNGVLLIIAPNDRKLRIEVGRGLEGQLTDIMSSLIINNAILPGFRRGEPVAGIKAGVRDISAVLLGDAEEVKRRLVLGKRPKSGGADALPLIFFGLWIGIVLYSIYWQRRQMRAVPASQRGRRRSGDHDVIVVPGGWGGSGGWSSGSSGGGGGGFSGGGGDFGGGGASGDW
jgi:uncharacterized protein